MTIQTKFLHDLRSRNAFQVFQEALDMTFMANLIQIFDHPDGNREENIKLCQNLLQKKYV